jgi:hypothetical protein
MALDTGWMSRVEEQCIRDPTEANDIQVTGIFTRDQTFLCSRTVRFPLSTPGTLSVEDMSTIADTLQAGGPQSTLLSDTRLYLAVDPDEHRDVEMAPVNPSRDVTIPPAPPHLVDLHSLIMMFEDKRINGKGTRRMAINGALRRTRRRKVV